MPSMQIMANWMAAVLCSWLALATLAAATSPNDAVCKAKPYKCILKHMRKSEAVASSYCYELLEISTPLPGTFTVVSPSTVTPIAVQTSDVTITKTITSTTTEFATDLKTSVAPGEYRTTTASTTSYSAAPVPARADKREEDARRRVGGSDADTTSQACKCLLDLPIPTTVTVVKTYTTTRTAVTFNTVTDEVTTPVTESKTLTVTTTTTAPASVSTSTQITVIQVEYRKKYGGDGFRCAYNRYYSAPSDLTTEQECRDRCTRDPACRMYAFSKYDPDLARGYDGVECDLDSQPFDTQYVQCNYVTSMFVVWDKVTAE